MAVIAALTTGCTSNTPTGFKSTKLNWGDPNLQGFWDYRTATPLTIPDELGDRTDFTDSERTDFESGSTERGVAFVKQVGNFVGDEPWADRGDKLTENSRAALIIDPPSGKLPQRTPYGKELSGQYFAQMAGPTNDPEDRTVLERCITAPLVPIRPLNFNNNIKIVQSPDFVVI